MKKFLIGLTALASLVACTKSSDGGDSQDGSKPAVTSFYNNSETQNYANQVSDALGVSVVVSDPKDFSNEYDIKRVLGLLLKNKDAIKPNLVDVDKIVIGSESDLKQNLDRYVINISYTISESQLLLMLTKYYDAQKQETRATKEFQTATGLTVEDRIGLSGDAITLATEKLKEVSQHVSFSEDDTFHDLVLADVFAITRTGMIININASRDEIESQLKSAIDARISWNRDTASMLANLDLSLSYQPGVFTGAELKAAMATLQTRAPLIKSLTRKLNRFVMGKRWDYDFNNSEVLFDYRTTDDVLKQNLQKYDPPVSDDDINAVRTSMLTTLSNRGYTLQQVIIDIPRTGNAIDYAKSFAAQVLPQVRIDLLQNLGIQTLHLVSTDQTQYIAATKELLVHLPADTATLEQTMSTAIAQRDYTNTSTALNNYASSIGVQVNLLDLSPSPATNSSLKAFSDWFMNTVTQSLKNSAQLSQVNVSNTGNSPSFQGGTLNVGLSGFTADEMQGVVVAPPPPPAPPQPPAQHKHQAQ